MELPKMRTSALWGIYSTSCLVYAAMVIVGALAGLSGGWLDAL